MIARLFSASKFVWAMLAAAGCLALALFLEGYFGISASEGETMFFLKRETWISVSKELFFAFFIAAIIILTIEASSKQEQQNEAKIAYDKFEDCVKTLNLAQRSDIVSALEDQGKSLDNTLQEIEARSVDAAFNVLRAANTNDLPKEIFDEINHSILNKPFLRSQHFRNVVLKPIPDVSDYLVMAVRQSYVVKNIGPVSTSLVTNVILPLSTNPYSHLTKFRSLKMESVDGKVNIPSVYPFEDSTRDGQKKIDQCRETLANGNEFKFAFPEILVPSGSEVQVTMDFDVAKDMSDTEVWTCLTATMSGSLVLRSEIPDLELRAIALHRGTLAASRENEDNGIYKRWTFDKPVLPFQGNVAFWGPKVDVDDS